MHVYCSDVRSHSSAPESNKRNPRDRTLDLAFLFRYKHIPSLKNLPSLAPNESLPYWFQGNFAASFVLNFCLREFLLSAFANRFELRCEPKRLMLLYYKICPCLHDDFYKWILMPLTLVCLSGLWWDLSGRLWYRTPRNNGSGDFGSDKDYGTKLWKRNQERPNV